MCLKQCSIFSLRITQVLNEKSTKFNNFWNATMALEKQKCAYLTTNCCHYFVEAQISDLQLYSTAI